ncbi:MAG: adenylate/guanylate cyclase domain-containing protein [Pseudomonadota bacterium]
MNFRQPNFSVTTTLFLVQLAVAAAVSATIVLFDRAERRQQALATAREMLDLTVTNLQLQVAALVDPVDSVVKSSRYWPRISDQPTASGHPARRFMIEFLGDHPQIASAFLGYDDGDYFQIAELVDVAPPLRHGAPPETVFSEDVVLRDAAGEVRSLTRFLDRHGGTLATRTDIHDGFDPRERPWYVAADATPGVARTEVYRFEGTDEPGISVSRRFDGGVMGADVAIAHLCQFLDATPQAKEGLVAIVHADGRLLARSTGTLAANAVLTAADQARLRELVARGLAEGTLPSSVVEIAGAPWVLRVAPVALGAGVDENLLVAMPVRTIMAPIDQVARRTGLVSVLIVAASIPLIWLLARLMTGPLLRLAAATERIQRFDLEEPPVRMSRIEEIRRLQEAVRAMRENLRTFALYVPKALVQQLIESGVTPRPGGERRDVTLLFMDLENFTPMSSRLSPEEVMTRMTSYFEGATRTLLDHEATVDKYIGDAVMAFWNAPNPSVDHVARACRAALAVIATVGPETDRWAETGGPPLRTRIGLHCGEAIVGNVGSSDRMNYTALGATVNFAARLEKLNRQLGTTILVSAEVVARAGNGFDFQPAGAHRMEGFDDPIEVFELVGERRPAIPASPTTGLIAGPG